jgi:hypothetical protein
MAMIYNRTARQMLVDLINEGNPDLPFPINLTDYEFTRPVGISVLPNGHNTEIRIIPKTTAPYNGNVLLTYRRLNLAYLFRNIIPTVRQWVPNNGNPNTGVIISNLHALLPLFSKKYGILLEPSQIQNVNLTNYNGLRGDNFTISAHSESLVFVGSTPANWILGRRTLEDLIQIDEIDGREYPDGNDFSDIQSRKPYLTPLFHNVDFTMYHQENGANWDRYNDVFWRVNSTLHITQENIYRGIMDTVFREKLGFGILPHTLNGRLYRNPFFNQGTTEEPDYVVGLRNLPYEPIRLPDSRYPEANSEFFNSAIVITIPEDCPWGTGNIYLHYNK